MALREQLGRKARLETTEQREQPERREQQVRVALREQLGRKAQLEMMEQREQLGRLERLA